MYGLGVPTTTSQPGSYTIQWIPRAVENLLHNNDIMTRTELSKVLNVARSTIYQTFDHNWSGEASLKVLAEMSGRFNVPIAELVASPCDPYRRRDTNGVYVRRAG